MNIQVTLKAKWQLKEFPKYKWTECKKLVNTNTGKIIKKTSNGNSCKVGYYINRKFIKVEDIVSKKLIEPIPKEKTPF
jgi:hypothetical protein